MTLEGPDTQRVRPVIDVGNESQATPDSTTPPISMSAPRASKNRATNSMDSVKVALVIFISQTCR